MCFGRPVTSPAGRRLPAPGQGCGAVGDERFPGEPPLVQGLGDAAVGGGFEQPERQVLQFPLELPDAEAVGQRRVDVEGLAGQGLALGAVARMRKRSVWVRLARRISTTRMSSTMASSILRSVSACGAGRGVPGRQRSGNPKDPSRCNSSTRRRMVWPKRSSIASGVIAPDSASGYSTAAARMSGSARISSSRDAIARPRAAAAAWAFPARACASSIEACRVSSGESAATVGSFTRRSSSFRL
jgi:hypothetical protein